VAVSPSSPAAGPPDVWCLVADLLDPPEWEPEGRPELEPHQVPPAGPWDLWLLEGGRGSGKTEACARYFCKYMRTHPGARGRIIAPTFGDAVEACIEGPSGILSIDPEARWLPSAPGGAKLVWPNGSEALVFGTHSPVDVDRLRAGGNRHIDWWEEMAANRQLEDAWDQAQLGLRLGDHPHSIASTTPRSTKTYRGLRETHPGTTVARTHGTIDDNPHLNEEWKAARKARYEGTRLGRQELKGELLDDVPGALWTYETLEACRVAEVPCDLAVVVTAVDPAATSTASADDTGIVVAALGTDGQGYILADRTCHLPPDGWGHRVVFTHHEFEGDRVVGEVNNGGEMVEHVIRTQDDRVPFKAVRASRGKQTRAEPVAALFGTPPARAAELGVPERSARVHLVGSHPELEDQLCTWVPEDAGSPDRLDALVWAVTDLMLGEGDGAVSVQNVLGGRGEPVVKRGDLVLKGVRYIDKT
jgi:phage terminase large subunit-like protein